MLERQKNMSKWLITSKLHVVASMLWQKETISQTRYVTFIYSRLLDR